ncbi:MAG: hypothetical protein EOO65_02300 [Methanosarcinales archaeon]|nr:MAG: hypothetical protein EOO65_02300 [Methanosarcinales archaeon]
MHAGQDELRRWCDAGYTAIQSYDAEFSAWLHVPTSIKTTSIKPSGTVSLLAGGTCSSVVMHVRHSLWKTVSAAVMYARGWLCSNAGHALP